MPEEVSAYVEQAARCIITPDGRGRAGFDAPIDLGADAGALERLVAFTGRQP